MGVRLGGLVSGRAGCGPDAPLRGSMIATLRPKP